MITGNYKTALGRNILTSVDGSGEKYKTYKLDDIIRNPIYHESAF